MDRNREGVQRLIEHVLLHNVIDRHFANGTISKQDFDTIKRAGERPLAASGVNRTDMSRAMGGVSIKVPGEPEPPVQEGGPATVAGSIMQATITMLMQVTQLYPPSRFPELAEDIRSVRQQGMER
jgi:hypothetical protein